MTSGYKDLIQAKMKSNSNLVTSKEILTKYLTYIPFFVISIIICFGIGKLYSRYVVKKYNAVAQILVRDASSGGTAGSNSSNDLIENAMIGVGLNVENEMQKLRSAGLMEGVVEKNGFNISYYKVGKIRKTEIYRDAPFDLVPQVIKDSSKSFSITLSDFVVGGGKLTYGPEDQLRSLSFKWHFPIIIDGNRFVLRPKYTIQAGSDDYLIILNPVRQTAAEILGDLSVGMLSQKMSIIQLSLLVENVKRGEDILNALCKEFKQSNIEEQNAITQNTIRFINERLEIVSGELNGVETNLEVYKGKNRGVDLERQSTQSFENSNAVSLNLASISNQKSVVEMIRLYITNPANQAKLVPSALGISDATLSGLITKYNDLQLKKDRETPLVSGNSILLKDIQNQLDDIRMNILENLKNIAGGLQLQELNLQKQNLKYSETLLSLPRKERTEQEIKRQLEIKESLFVYLLQKRESAAISLSSTSSNFKQIDPASGYGPVVPDTKLINKIAILAGLLIPIGYIYIRDLLNDKVVGKAEINATTQVPIIGEISHIQKKRKTAIIATVNSGFAEQFRSIRTNLSFLMDPSKKVILVTSSNSGDGKSLISINFASIMAMPGKKIALLELDLRKKISDRNIISLSGASKGLSNYLSGQTDDLSEIYSQVDGLPGLHIFPSGGIVPNPSDLLVSARLPSFFDTLKKQYDYIIIDSGPVGLVGDAMVLGKYSDATLFVIRQQYTLKKELANMDELYRTNKLPDLCIILNDIKYSKNYFRAINKTEHSYYVNDSSDTKMPIFTKVKNNNNGKI